MSTEVKEKTDSTFLERMFADLNDISCGTDEQVRSELVEMGIDPDAAKKRFLEVIKECMVIKTVKVFEVDGVRFDNEEKAQEYERLCVRVAAAVAPLGKRRNDSSFLDGVGHVQHDLDIVDAVYRDVVAIARERYPWCESNAAMPRCACDSGDACLNKAFYRLQCIAKNGREYGQPYFALNPWEAKDTQ